MQSDNKLISYFIYILIVTALIGFMSGCLKDGLTSLCIPVDAKSPATLLSQFMINKFDERAVLMAVEVVRLGEERERYRRHLPQVALLDLSVCPNVMVAARHQNKIETSDAGVLLDRLFDTIPALGHDHELGAVMPPDLARSPVNLSLFVNRDECERCVVGGGDFMAVFYRNIKHKDIVLAYIKYE